MSRILPVLLTDEQWERLDNLADAANISKAEMVRQAVDGYISDRPAVSGETARTLLRRNLRLLRDLSR